MIKTLITSFIFVSIIFLIIDVIWLSITVKSLYRPALGDLLNDKPVMWAAALFYIIYVVSLTLIILRPALANESVFQAFWTGAVFGIAACLVVLAVYRRNRGMDFIYQINYQPLVIMLGLNLVMGQIVDRIDNWGHIGGLITGVLIGFVYIIQSEKRNAR